MAEDSHQKRPDARGNRGMRLEKKSVSGLQVIIFYIMV